MEIKTEGIKHGGKFEEKEKRVRDGERRKEKEEEDPCQNCFRNDFRNQKRDIQMQFTKEVDAVV